MIDHYEFQNWTLIQKVLLCKNMSLNHFSLMKGRLSQSIQTCLGMQVRSRLYCS